MHTCINIKELGKKYYVRRFRLASAELDDSALASGDSKAFMLR
jgi:hypothetical protein